MYTHRYALAEQAKEENGNKHKALVFYAYKQIIKFHNGFISFNNRSLFILGSWDEKSIAAHASKMLIRDQK